MNERHLYIFLFESILEPLFQDQSMSPYTTVSYGHNGFQNVHDKWQRRFNISTFQKLVLFNLLFFENLYHVDIVIPLVYLTKTCMPQFVL